MHDRPGVASHCFHPFVLYLVYGHGFGVVSSRLVSDSSPFAVMRLSDPSHLGWFWGVHRDRRVP